MWPFDLLKRDNSALYWSWLADKAMLMANGKHREYPVSSDAALFVLVPPNPQRVEYRDLVVFLEKATAKNERTASGFPIVAIDLPDGKTIKVALDFSQKERSFRLVSTTEP